jgi:hypothetical protein
MFLIFKFVEYVYCANILKQPPMVSCIKSERRIITKEICDNYKNAKNICDMGSGFGGLVRSVARCTNADVYGIENMLFSVLVSRFLNLFCPKKITIIYSDIFKFMDKPDVFFDIVIAYLGPKTTPMLEKYKNKIGVLITVDFEIEKLSPTRTVDIGHGYTIYKRKKYPHKLYIYEFK